MPNFKVALLEQDGVELHMQTELQLTASNVSAVTTNGLTSDETQGQLDELAARVFGLDYDEAVSLGDDSTTSNDWSDKIDNTFSGLTDGGKYIVKWFTLCKFEKAESGLNMRVRLDGSTDVEVDLKYGEKQEDEDFSWTGFTTVTLSGATTLQVELQFNSPNDEDEVELSETKIEIWRVA
jgi:hypothetical protein